MNAPSANPVLVELIHGSGVASIYRGAAVVVDGTGETLHAIGEVVAPACIRSSLKPLQALALVRSGAADAFDLTDDDLALACGSHAGEAMHLERLSAWLERLGVTEADLACGPSLPIGAAAREAALRAGTAPRKLMHNCAGKHAGFLTLARHRGLPVQGYCDPAGAVQREVLGEIANLLGVDPGPTVNVDGCHAPNFFAPLDAYARGFARFMQMPEGQRLIAAMAAWPMLVSGTGRLATLLMQATEGAVVAKEGAEGAIVAMVPARGLVVLLKMDDGQMPPAETALCHLLEGLGVLSGQAIRALDLFLNRPMLSSREVRIGSYRPTAQLTRRPPRA